MFPHTKDDHTDHTSKLQCTVQDGPVPELRESGQGRRNVNCVRRFCTPKLRDDELVRWNVQS